MSRPEYVHCIERYRMDEKGRAYCGRDVSMEFKFLDPMHAAFSSGTHGRFMICDGCVGEVLRLLAEGMYEPSTAEGTP